MRRVTGMWDIFFGISEPISCLDFGAMWDSSFFFFSFSAAATRPESLAVLRTYYPIDVDSETSRATWDVRNLRGFFSPTLALL